MRIAFLLLLLANALLFGWARGYWGGEASHSEKERLQRQVAPESVRILSDMEQAKTTQACRRIEWLTGAEAESIRQTIGAMAGWKVTVVPGPPLKLHWVAIPELPSQAIAERKLREAAKLGVNSGEIVDDAGNGPFLLRLGSFDKQATAETFHQSIIGKGVRSARLLLREAASDQYAIELHAPAAELTARLPGLFDLLPKVQASACPHS